MIPARTLRETRFGGFFVALAHRIACCDYLRLEWYGWRFYWRHSLEVTAETWVADLRPLRALLSVPSFGIALWLWHPAPAFNAPGYEYMKHWLTENQLGLIFCMHGVGMLWRMYAPRRVTFWTAFFGCWGISIYFGFPILVYFDIKRLTVQGISMFAWGFACFWITSRLGHGQDRYGP